MSGDRVRIESLLQNDERLLEGISVIVLHAASYSGIHQKASAELAVETVAACRKALKTIGDKQHTKDSVRVLVDQYQDRVETIVEYDGDDIPGSGSGHSQVKFVRYCDALDSKRAD